MQILKGLNFLKAYTTSTSYINTDLNLVMKMVNDLDKNCDQKLKTRFNKNPYAKTFYQQPDLKDVVLSNKYKKDTLGKALQIFWQTNADDLFKKNYDLSQIKGKKNIKYMKGVLNEHDVIHCVNNLDSTPLAELSVLAFTLAKEFRWSFFYICLASIFLAFKNSFGKNAIKGNLLFRLKYTPVISVLRLLKEGYANGKQTTWFMTVNWHNYLHLPIETVRQDLNIPNFAAWEDIKPKWYQLLKLYKKNYQNEKRTLC